jgi:hypothetical protein
LIGWFSSKGEDKHQIVRLIDVFIYGPLLIYIAVNYKTLKAEWVPYFLILLGGATIGYNLRNYLHIKGSIFDELKELGLM